MNDPFSKAQPTRDVDASSFERDPEPFENENAIGGVSDTRKGTERRERAMAVLKARGII